jgi:CHAT domain-containing protein/Tfp pilus assembly protein PilF
MWLCLLVLMLALTLLPALAAAAPPGQEPTPTLMPGEEKTRADALLDEGVDLLFNADDYEGALAKFREARELYHALGELEKEADALTGVGLAYDYLGQPEKALAAQQAALNLARQAASRRVEQDALFNIGEVYVHLGQYQESLSYYQQALTIAREMGDQNGEGNTLNRIGVVYHNQGRYAEALESFQQALSIYQEAGNRTWEGNTLNNIGLEYEAQGRYARALESFQQTLSIYREMGNRTGEGNTLHNIGAVYYGQGRYAKALEMYQQALAIAREMGDRDGEGTTLNNIGTVYDEQGRYAEALESFQQALAIAREVGDQNGEGNALNNIGAVYEVQGRNAEALESFQQALTIRQGLGDRAKEGISLNNIGAVYYDQGHYAEAREMYQQALAIAREVGDRAGEGNALHNIGNIYQAQGRYAEALESFQQALAIAHEVGDRAGEGNTLGSIGAVYDKQGRYAEALEMYQQALAIRREVGDRAGEGRALTQIGTVYDAQERYTEALKYYQQAMDVLEAVRALAGSELGRAAFIAEYAGLYARVASLFHQQGHDEEAFFASERGRARAFLDSLATGHVELTDNEAAALLAREQEAYKSRQAAQVALVRARALDPPDPALVADLEAQLAEAEATYTKALADIEARGDQLAALTPGRSTVLTLSDVQALLDQQTTLVSYFVIGDETLAFIVTHDSFHTVVLDVDPEELVTQIKAFHDFPNLNVAHLDSAVALYGWLIEPLKEYLPSRGSGQRAMPHLAIVPHSALHYLPFAALTDGQRYLVDDYVITYLPSASALPFIQANVGGTGLPLILGNPTTGDPKLRPLNFAEQEAQAIATLYDVQPLLGETATESALWEQVSQAGILHLAAHGGYNRYNPLYSAIALAPDGENDGQLEVHEVYGLDLKNADLVVLSACQTQIGELSAGDEVVGLNRAFLYAGTPSVMASLWHVDDAATALLMEHFYTHLRAGLGKAEALRQAQIDVRTEYPHPYYWAAFVLTGDAGEVTGEVVISAATPLEEATTAPVDETPRAEETPAPAKSGGGPCPAGALILALGVGVAFITNRRISP